MKKLLLIFMSFFSLLGYAQFSEGFEGTIFPPTGWIRFENGTGIAQQWNETSTPALVFAGSKAAYLNKENVVTGMAEDWLVTRQVLVPTNGQLRFYTKLTQAGPQGSEYTIRVSRISQNNPGDFLTIRTWTEPQIMDDDDLGDSGSTLAQQSTYLQKSVNLSAYAGLNVYIAFVMSNDDGDRWCIDNVNVDQQCLVNTGLLATPLATSASLSWTSSSTGPWEIEYGPLGFTQGTGTIVLATTNVNFSLSPLFALTEYTYYVRSLCASDNISPWSTGLDFTTSASPPGCDGNFIDSGGSSGPYSNNEDITTTICPTNPGDIVTVTFTSFNIENRWDALYVYDGNSIASPIFDSGLGVGLGPNAGISGGFWGTTVIGPFTASSSNGCLTFRFRSDGSATRTGWIANVTCTPPPTCPAPTNIVVSGANSSSASVAWVNVAPATQWEIIWLPAGSPAPGPGATPNAVTSSNPYLITGLNSATNYVVYVRAVCVAGVEFSAWTAGTPFSTTPNYCSGDVFTDPGGTTGQYGNNANVTTTICPENPGDAVVVIFNSFNLENNFDFLRIYDGNSTAAPLIGTFTGTNLPPQVIATSASGCLTFNFTSDGLVVRDGWNASVICGPPPACTQPTNLTVTNITSSGATIGWTETNPGVTSWQVVVQPAGTGYPNTSSTVINVSTNPYTITGLNPNLSYEYYVRSNCGSTDGFSFWSGPVRFNTLFAGCNGSTPAGNECGVAPPVCNLDGYCGNTSGTYTDNSWGALDTAFCGSIENNSFLSFQAASTSISLAVNVGNCTNGSGIQFMVFTTPTCGSGPVTDLGCYFEMDPGVNNLTFTNLVPGQNYFLMIDGFAGAICDYSVTVTSGGSTTTDVVLAPQNPTICLGETIALTASGGNGVYNWTGTGLSATTGTTVNFVATTPGTYTIVTESTDTNPICSTQNSIEITVLDVLQPTFSNPGQICVGSPNIPLSNTDSNGVTGVWSVGGNPVTEIDASVGGIFTYTFTPDLPAFQCSPIFTMDIEIITSCTFNAFATAVYIDNCETTDPGEFFNITGSGADLIAPAANVYTNNDFGTYVQNSGNLILKGAELKSFKTATSNVCGANMFYRVYLASATPGAFNTLALPFYDDCVGATFPTGGPCDLGDQKWRNIAQAIDLTQNAPGDYIVEVYFDILGDNDSPSQCDDTILVNNAGNNFIANFSIQSAITFTSQNEECGSSNAFINVSGFNPGDIYSVTYNDDTVAVGPANFQANLTGNIIINGLNAGTYDNFNFVINGCSIFEATPIVITNFSPSITQVSSNTEICVGSNAVFTIQGSPNFNVSYTINGGVPQSTTLNASGLATVTINTPPAGNVILQLINIFNTSCSIPFANSSTVLVNALPTATLSVVDTNICLGVGNAEFIITGTPNALVSYNVNGGAPETITIGALGTVTLSMNLPTSNVTVTLTGVTLGICSNVINGQTGTVVVTSIPVPVINVTQTPVCSNQTAAFTVTSPVNNLLNIPTNLFISEITDAQSGSLTYVEIYNGTGGPIDLANYKLKVYTSTVGAPSCNLLLSGILANNDVVVVKLSSSPNQGGIVPDLTFTTCNGVNNNDSIVLTTSTDVEIDVWGVNGVVFTPAGGVGYNYRRNTNAVLPTITWNPADWQVIDWTNTAPNLPDYSNVGIYTLYVSNYEYTLSNGVTSSTQSSVNFTAVAPGTYTLVATDLMTGCSSNPLTFTIDPVVYTNPVTTFSYTTPVCISSVTNPVPNTSAVGFASGGTYSSTAGLAINASTGVIDLTNSTAGTYVVTYSVTIDATNCLNAGSSQATIVITPNNPSTFTNITGVCEGTTASLPTTSIEGYSGTWLPAAIDTSIIGTTTYTFTPTAGQCAAVGTIQVTIDDRSLPTFTQIDDLCLGASIQLPLTSNEGVTGTWNPATVNTSQVGIITYTFTPDVSFCADVTTMDVHVISCDIPKGVSPNGDGLNDTWDLSGYNVKKVEIFNRYGTKVYSKSNYVDEWHGQSDNSNELPDGTYYYVVEFNDSPVKTGWVYINREQ